MFKLIKYLKKLDKTFEVFELISKRRNIQFFYISIIALFAALFETISIGLLIPIISLLTANSNNDYDQNRYLDLFEKYNFTNIDSSYLIVCFFIIVILLGTITKIMYAYLQAKYGELIVQEFNQSILRNSILKPYEEYNSSESSVYVSAILNKSNFISRYLRNILTFIVTILTLVSIICALLFINSQLTIFVFLFIFIFYLTISISIKKRVKIIGKIVSELATKELQLLNDIDGYQREILLNNNFLQFLNNFNFIDKKIRNKNAESSFLKVTPRYLLESLVLIFGSLIILISIRNNNFNINWLPFLGAFLLGIQKLLPIVQSFYSTWINHRTCQNGVLEIIRLTKEFKEYSNAYLKEEIDHLLFNKFKKIQIRGLDFSYQNSEKLIFKDLNINIKRGEFIGIIGNSGEGKSTLLNILSGLNQPTKGHLVVDNIDVYKNFRNLKSWRKNISYVSQNNYLTSKSIISNITMCENNFEVDNKKLKKVIKISQLDIYIKSLKDGLNTLVGEKGVQISGGQKQRIFLARALYNNSSLLILDEATSALDKTNEINIINSLNKLINSDKTIIAVSHKIEILKNCDRIFLLNRGLLIEKKYEELINYKIK